MSNIRHNGKLIIKDKCIIRGDLAQIKLGKYVVVHKGSTIHPAFMIKRKGLINFLKIEIGDYV